MLRSMGSVVGSAADGPPSTGAMYDSHCSTAAQPSKSSSTTWWLTPLTPITCGARGDALGGRGAGAARRRPLSAGCAAWHATPAGLSERQAGAHLGPAELHVGRVDLAPQQLVQRRVAGQDDGLVGALDAPARAATASRARRAQPAPARLGSSARASG